jgi:hypothetical protein
MAPDFLRRAACVLLAMGLPALAAAQQGCTGSFLNTQQRFPFNEARAANAPQVFGRGAPLENVTYRVAGDSEAHSLEDYLTRFCTTGFLVLHEDRGPGRFAVRIHVEDDPLASGRGGGR